VSEVCEREGDMSTKNIEEALLSLGLTHDVSKAWAELDAIRKERRLLRTQLGALREQCERCAVVDPEAALEAVERMERILGVEESP
jgi:hypothetical protein